MTCDNKNEVDREVIMTREDVKKLFPEATDEQITGILNQNNSEVAKEKGKAEKIKTELDDLKASAASVEELQKKIEEIEQSKMTETEKIAKELEKSNARVAELEKSIAIQQSRADATEKFKVTAEQAKQIVKDDGSFDYDALGTIIAEKEAAAANAKEQEIAHASTNPGGQPGDGGTNSMATEMAVASAKRAGVANESILANYRR